MFDEFALRSPVPALSVPSQPYQGALDLTRIGGFGNGNDGTFTLTSGSCYSNAYGTVTGAAGVSFTVDSWHKPTTCMGSKPNAGDELMFLVRKKSGGINGLQGLYAFRFITGIQGTSFTIDSPITEEFDMSEAVSNYTVTAHKIPHFSSVNISGGSLLMYNHVAAFRCTGNATINGAVYSSSVAQRIDDFDLSHSDLPDRMIPSMGNILFFCGGTFTAGTNARLGHAPGDVANKAGYGGKSDNIMIATQSNSQYYGANVLIAARKLAIDENALAYGALNSVHYSGLCYLAGDFS